MNKLSTSKRAQIIGALVEGNSMRAASRMTGVAFNTVLKLVPEIGRASADYHPRTSCFYCLPQHLAPLELERA